MEDSAAESPLWNVDNIEFLERYTMYTVYDDIVN